MGPMINSMTKAEQTAFERGMDAWEASLARPDLTERDRVAGALKAYMDCYFAQHEMGEIMRAALLDEKTFWETP